jgi:hypothetical protein
MIERIVEEMRTTLSPLVGDNVDVWMIYDREPVRGEVFRVTATQVELRAQRKSTPTQALHLRLDQIQMVIRSAGDAR